LHDSVEKCVICPGGKFQKVSGQPDCNMCENNTYTTADGKGCMLCQPGQYEVASSGCQVCAGGRYQNISGQKKCRECPGGRHRPSTSDPLLHDSVQDCSVCNIGKFAEAGGSLVCSDCPSGKFASQKGSLACAECDAGSYHESLAQSVPCKICGAGQYIESKSQPSCKFCVLGKFLLDEATTSSFHDSESDCEDCGLQSITYPGCTPILFGALFGGIVTLPAAAFIWSRCRRARRKRAKATTAATTPVKETKVMIDPSSGRKVEI